jgi:hypothetical protein
MTGHKRKVRRLEKLRKRKTDLDQVKERLGMKRPQSFDRIDNPQRPKIGREYLR